jgi:putative nucleotidyltransferase with HDIG domain
MGAFFKAFSKDSPDLPIRLYAAALVTLASALVAGIVLTQGLESNESALPLVGFALLAMLAERQSVRLTENIELSVAFLPLLFVAVVFGPLPAAVVGAVTVLPDFGRPFTRWVIWTANRTIIGAAAGLAALLAPGTDGAVGTILAATFLAAIADFALDLVLNTLTLVIRGTGSARDLAKATGPVALAGIPLYTCVVGILAYAYVELSPWTAALFFIPAYAAQRLFVMYREQRETLNDLAHANARLESANLSFASALVATLDARDRYTAGHSAAVAVYSRDIAARMGLSEGEQQLVHLCGLVHDIGKVGLAPGLLEKGGALTLEERRQMEQHPVIGERILSKVEGYSDIARIVRHHHERTDGLGYPDNLGGDDIPLLSRIIAVADAYNAMTSDRPYRDAMPSRVARLRLAQAVESQFDTSVVAAFEAVLAGAAEAYRSGQREDFSLEVKHATPVALRVATA